MDRHTKLELQIRTAFRTFWIDRLSSGKQRAVLIPGFEIPRAETVDLILGPKKGTSLCLVQRSDFVVVYKHTVGQLMGTLGHYHKMTDREIREALRATTAHPDLEELQQEPIDVLNISKRLIAERKAGEVTLLLASDTPEVVQQALELKANFFPVMALMQAWLPTPVGPKKKRLCKSVEFFGVEVNMEPMVVHPMADAVAGILKDN